MKFKSNIQKYRYIEDVKGINMVCMRCGHIFGQHSGLTCPGGKGEFLLLEEVKDSNNDPNLAFIVKRSTNW